MTENSNGQYRLMIVRRFFNLCCLHYEAPIPKTKARRVLKTFISEPSGSKINPEDVPEEHID